MLKDTRNSNAPHTSQQNGHAEQFMYTVMGKLEACISAFSIAHTKLYTTDMSCEKDHIGWHPLWSKSLVLHCITLSLSMTSKSMVRKAWFFALQWPVVAVLSCLGLVADQLTSKWGKKPEWTGRENTTYIPSHFIHPAPIISSLLNSEGSVVNANNSIGPLCQWFSWQGM